MSDQLLDVIRQLATQVPAHPGYTAALTAHYNREGARAAALVAEALTEDHDGAMTMPLYRLWIETLAESGDQKSLRALADHLRLRAAADPAARVTWLALRGIVHLELDEYDAAELITRGVAGINHDPYCLELVQRVEARTAAQVTSTPALLRSTVPLTDYCHWRLLARAMMQAGNRPALTETLTRAQALFRGAPLMKTFEYHLEIHAGNYAAAALVASRLTEMYPACVDYQYYEAYALFEDGDYPSARRILKGVLASGAGQDPEVIGLLGHCHAKLGDPEQAAPLLSRAAEMLREQGLPASQLALELSNVQEELRGGTLNPAVEMPREPQNWLVKLSPRRAHELLTSSEATVDRLLRPMGSQPREGDICLFAVEDRAKGQSEGLWKIIAIYAVDSDPIWHPVHGHHTALKRVAPLPTPVVVEVRITDDKPLSMAEFRKVAAKFGVEVQGSRLALPRNDAFTYGVYRIDGGVLDLIEGAATMRPDELIERRRNAESRRPTA